MTPPIHITPPAMPRDERALLEAAATWEPSTSGAEIRAEQFARLAIERGIDFATAVLYDQLRRNPATDTLMRDDAFDNAATEAAPPQHALLAVVPGALYREYPKTGADGKVIREIAESLGWQTELVPLASDGPPEQNGHALLEWLETRADRPVLLMSLSKGSADVKAAFDAAGTSDPFRSVFGWINFGGILNGSPMAAWVLQRRLARWFFRGLFRCTGHDFRMMTELRYGDDSPMSAPMRLPAHIPAIHVAGFPLRKHLGSPRARRWHKRLSVWGPNDSVTILADVATWPGVVWPVWGTDHYLQSRWHPERLIPSLLRSIMREPALRTTGQLVSDF